MLTNYYLLENGPMPGRPDPFFLLFLSSADFFFSKLTFSKNPLGLHMIRAKGFESRAAPTFLS